MKILTNNQESEMSYVLDKIEATHEKTIAAYEKKIEIYENIFRKIALLGGNLSDENLTSKTGPNDAVARGLMYIRARIYATTMLGETIPEIMKKIK